MTVKLLTEHHLKLLSLQGSCTGSSESTLVKIPHCWKSHVTALMLMFFILGYTGRYCEQEIDECVGVPCPGGTCFDDIGTYYCRCPLGKTGGSCGRSKYHFNHNITQGLFPSEIDSKSRFSPKVIKKS